MSSIRTQREERTEANRVPVFGLVSRAFVAVRNLLRRKAPQRRYYEAPRPEERRKL